MLLPTSQAPTAPSAPVSTGGPLRVAGGARQLRHVVSFSQQQTTWVQMEQQQQRMRAHGAVREFIHRSCSPGSRWSRERRNFQGAPLLPQQQQQQGREVSGWPATRPAPRSSSLAASQQGAREVQQPLHQQQQPAATASAVVERGPHQSGGASAKVANDGSLPERGLLRPTAARAPRAMLSAGRPLTARGSAGPRVLKVYTGSGSCISICCCDPQQATTGWLLSRVLQHLAETGEL